MLLSIKLLFRIGDYCMKKESPKYGYCNKSHKQFKDSRYLTAPIAFCRRSRRYKWPLAMNEPDSVFSPLFYFFTQVQHVRHGTAVRVFNKPK